MKPLRLYKLPQGSCIAIGGVWEYTDADLWTKAASVDKAQACFRERLASERYFVPREDLGVDPTDIADCGLAPLPKEAEP